VLEVLRNKMYVMLCCRTCFVFRVQDHDDNALGKPPRVQVTPSFTQNDNI